MKNRLFQKLCRNIPERYDFKNSHIFIFPDFSGKNCKFPNFTKSFFALARTSKMIEIFILFVSSYECVYVCGMLDRVCKGIGLNF